MENNKHELTEKDLENAIKLAKKEVLLQVCDWLKKNITFKHPRTGRKKCIVNLIMLKDYISDLNDLSNLNDLNYQTYDTGRNETTAPDGV